MHDPGRWRAVVARTWTSPSSWTAASQGIRWSVTGALTGSAELWLEPVGDGVVVHYYLRVDPAGRRAGRARVAARAPGRPRRAAALAWKRHVNALKDELEGGRALGCPGTG